MKTELDVDPVNPVVLVFGGAGVVDPVPVVLVVLLVFGGVGVVDAVPVVLVMVVFGGAGVVCSVK